MNNKESQTITESSRVIGEAVFSKDMKFRYRLSRVWGEEEYDQHDEKGEGDWYQKVVCFILNNPSSADGLCNDQSTVNCMRIVRGLKNAPNDQLTYCDPWQENVLPEYDGIAIYNLFAQIKTKPKDLGNNEDAVGDLNDQYLKEIARYQRVILGWGDCSIPTDLKPIRNKQIDKIHHLLGNKEIYCMKDPTKSTKLLVKGKTPRHPSRFKCEKIQLELVRFNAEGQLTDNTGSKQPH